VACVGNSAGKLRQEANHVQNLAKRQCPVA
jgi:hypothetical protein